MAVAVVDGRVYQDGAEVQLEPLELAIVQLLAANPGTIYSKQRIFHNCWPVRQEVEWPDEAVHNAIYNLRKKLGREVIQTHPTRGYSWRPQGTPCPQCQGRGFI